MAFSWTILGRSIEVLRRGFEAARLDPNEYGVRVRLVRGITQTSFADHPESDDLTIEVDGIRIFLDSSVTKHARASIMTTAEHDQVVVEVSDD